MSVDDNTKIAAKIKAYRQEEKGELIGRLILAEQKCERIRDEAIDDALKIVHRIASPDAGQFYTSIRNLKGE